MSTTPKISAKELSKVIQKLGFFYSHTTGSHMVYKHNDGRTIEFYTQPPGGEDRNWASSKNY